MKSARPKTNGIALIATILILAMCFSSILTVLSLTSLSLKRGGKTQYHSYQALLAAESGINSFRARAANNLFDSSKTDLTIDGLNQWLEQNSLDELNLLEDTQLNSNQSIQNTLGFSNLTPQSATLESIGTVGTTLESGEAVILAKKILKVDFKLHAAGSQLRIQPTAALTTLGDLNLEGSAQLTGATAQESAGLIRDYDQARASPTPLPNNKVQLRIQHANRFHTGQYIELESGRYKVTTVDKNASTLELQPLSSNSSDLLTNDEIALIPIALTTAISITNAQSIELPISISQGQALAIGQSISVNDYVATIDSIDGDSVTITWTTSVPSEVLLEGSTVSLGILGARASQTILASTDTTLIGGKEEKANLNETSLFENSFGLSKDDLLGELNSYDQRNGKSFNLQTVNELQSLAKLNGLYYSEDTLYFDASHPLCGNAIIVSSADIAVDAVCEEGFSGLLYAFGNYRQTGGQIEGAVISEASNPLSTSSTHLSGDASINYNANAFNSWYSYLQDGIALQDGKQNFQQVAGSWRLE